jgi:hypothetical protein
MREYGHAATGLALMVVEQDEEAIARQLGPYGALKEVRHMQEREASQVALEASIEHLTVALEREALRKLAIAEHKRKVRLARQHGKSLRG